MNDIITQSLMK